jgi:hypothetical protein
MEKTLSQKVNETFKDCLYRDAEIPEDGTPKDAVLVEGIVQKFGFHPARLAGHKEEIRAYLERMPKEFHRETGGGWTFLNLCMDREGHQWAEHPTIEQLVALAIGTGMGVYLLPRDMWNALPGGVPYVMFDTSKPN